MKPKILAPSYCRVLEMVMRIADTGRSVKADDVRQSLGWGGMGYTGHCLRKLKRVGLIEMEVDGNDRILAGTIRPSVRFIPVENIGCE